MATRRCLSPRTKLSFGILSPIVDSAVRMGCEFVCPLVSVARYAPVCRLRNWSEHFVDPLGALPGNPVINGRLTSRINRINHRFGVSTHVYTADSAVLTKLRDRLHPSEQRSELNVRIRYERRKLL
jgi:hypothetical protein